MSVFQLLVRDNRECYNGGANRWHQSGTDRPREILSRNLAVVTNALFASYVERVMGLEPTTFSKLYGPTAQLIPSLST